MIHLPIIAGLRRAMRRHQGLAAPGRRIPLWRLLAGEFGWALRQLAHGPWVLVGLVLGFAATMGVLGASAPGPVVASPWRLLAAVGAGLLVAGAVRGVQLSGDGFGTRRSGEQPHNRPLTGATLVSGGVTVVVLIAWLLAWLVG